MKLDLDGLSYKVSEIIDELEKTKNIPDISKLVEEILELMKNRNEYFYQFTHGGARTGFMGNSAFLINTCNKILSLIKIDAKEDVILENKDNIIQHAKIMLKTIEGNSHFRVINPMALPFYKPP